MNGAEIMLGSVIPTGTLLELSGASRRSAREAGIPERAAMHLAGHKTRSVFERDNIVSDGNIRTAAKQRG